MTDAVQAVVNRITGNFGNADGEVEYAATPLNLVDLQDDDTPAFVRTLRVRAFVYKAAMPGPEENMEAGAPV